MKEIKKTELIKDMFENKLKHYKYKSLLTFESFYNPSMSNKTVSLNRIEEQISDFLEKVELDINVINNDVNRDEVMLEYLQHFNIAKALTDVSERNKKKEKVIETTINEMKVEKRFIYTIENEKDAKLLELLMKENNIKYRKEVK